MGLLLQQLKGSPLAPSLSGMRTSHFNAARKQQHQRHSSSGALPNSPPQPRRRLPRPPRGSTGGSDASNPRVYESIDLPDSEGTTAAAAASPLVEGLEEAAAGAAAAAAPLSDGEAGDAGGAAGLLASGDVREMLGFALPALGMVLAGGCTPGGARSGSGIAPAAACCCPAGGSPMTAGPRSQARADAHPLIDASADTVSCPLADPLMSLIDTACVGRVDALQLAALGPNTALFSFAFQVLGGARGVPGGCPHCRVDPLGV